MNTNPNKKTVPPDSIPQIQSRATPIRRAAPALPPSRQAGRRRDGVNPELPGSRAGPAKIRHPPRATPHGESIFFFRTRRNPELTPVGTVRARRRKCSYLVRVI